MIGHETERLSAYLDGELAAAEVSALERHLEECLDCRRALAELREVSARARGLPDLVPSTDLWRGIATRIDSLPQADPSSSLQVIDLRTRKSSRLSQRIAITLPQLAAASIVLMLLSGGAVWLAMKGSALAPVAADLTPTSVRMVSVGPDQVTDYSSAVRALEDALRQQRSRLDPVTVAILEENIRAIDTAITEAEAALERDPGNLYLNQHLDNTMKKKIQLLRRAAGLPNARI